MPLDCGIDIGSTNLKIVLVNEEGRTVHVRSVPSPRTSDALGPVTSPLDLVDQIETLIIAGWSEYGSGKPLRSIAAAGVGEDGIGVDKDLHPTGPAIPWFDKRALHEAAALRQHGDFTSQTGIAIESDRTIAKWAWLRKHRPQELDAARHWIALTDFPAVFWTGRPFMSASLAPRTACFDILGRKWVDLLLEAVGAPPLPEILGAGEALGVVRGGRLRDVGVASASTIVAAGGHDHPVAASVIRRLDPSGIVDSLGTANLLYGELPSAGSLPRAPNLAFSLPPEGGSRLSCLGVLELSAALADVREQGDAFWNFLAQKRMPGTPGDTGDPLGSSTSNTVDIRRALEDVTLRAKRMLTQMYSAGVEQGAIYTSGGWSCSHGFAELRASIFGQPIHAVQDMEVTAVGAALFGAQATTGRADCPLGPNDINTIEPVAEWTAAYDKLFVERYGAQATDAKGDAA